MNRITNIPDDYFNDEVRDDYRVISMIKRCWASSIEVLMQADQICRRHGIRYRAAYGTLLGAVRHHGFIPWDDDLDIAMMRADYMRFISAAREELPAPLTLHSIYLQKDHSQPFSSITNRSDVGQDKDLNELFYGCPFICGIDIFPMDYLPEDEEELNTFLNLYTICYDTCMRFDELLESGELVSRIDTISELTGVQIEVDRQLLSEIRKDSADILNKDPLVTDLRNRLFRLLDTMASMYGPDDSNRVGSVHEQVTHKRKIFDADVMTDTMMQPFEMIEIPVPVKYDELLTANYGDWRTEYRNTHGRHDYPFYRKQIDYLPDDYDKNGLLPSELL